MGYRSIAEGWKEFKRLNPHMGLTEKDEFVFWHGAKTTLHILHGTKDFESLRVEVNDWTTRYLLEHPEKE
jgi:hypothetical protein